MTISDIISEYGSLYRNSGQGQQDIIALMREQAKTESFFTRILTDNTVIEKASSSISNVLQQFQKAWTPKGQATFKPRKIELTRLKIDVQETPDDLVDTWLEFLSNLSAGERTQWPFTRWWITQVLAQAREDFEKFEVFKGLKGSVTAGTATTSGNSIKGIRKIIRDGVAGSTINSIATGALETDPVQFVAQVEDWFNQIPELQRNEMDVIFMSQTLFQRYRTGMRQTYNMNYSQADLTTIIDTNTRVEGFVSQSGSEMIWTTPRWNRIVGLKTPSNQDVMTLQAVDRTIKAFTDFHKGLGFLIHEYVYCNDRDLS